MLLKSRNNDKGRLNNYKQTVPQLAQKVPLSGQEKVFTLGKHSIMSLWFGKQWGHIVALNHHLAYTLMQRMTCVTILTLNDNAHARTSSLMIRLQNLH